ncbi:MAG: benzoate/H(+) symporter BenE family transporter [Rhizobacter sp.]|nr:benzoate/H(+) symporter BenE family transporter [Burkholderiales bacterium]
MSFFRDLSLSAVVTGFVVVLVGLSSTGALVFQAALSLGASQAQVSSWIWALGLGMGLSSIIPSLIYKKPVVAAWSTPGAALIATSAAGVTMPEAVGAFVFCAVLIIIAGASGLFERLMKRIPIAIASAMLAGVLLRFGLEAFSSIKTAPVMVLLMFVAHLLGRRFWPRYGVVGVLGVGAAIAASADALKWSAVTVEWAQPMWVTPEFSLSAIIGLGLPLFMVTMASQNMPGVAVMRGAGYDTPISPVITTIGIINLIFAPFGAFALNLAAITAAISMGREAHEDKDKRYTAAVMAGVFYCLIGLIGAIVGGLFAAFPRELIATLAGLALMGTIGNGLATAVIEERGREAAIITFLITASGVSILGIGSAFWGLVGGVLAMAVLSRRST